MPRMARLVVPGYPHHVTQRGNRRQRTFFSTDDYQAYVWLMAAARYKADAEILAYCLMPNHVHLVVVPKRKDSLSGLFKESHRRYTRRINQARGWRGHLWQERFHSCPMDEGHLVACVRYVELNPVRAGLCDTAEAWPWSSARAHLSRVDDYLVSAKPMLDRIHDWESYLQRDEDDETLESIREHSRTGRPIGGEAFIERLELLTGRSIKPKRRGRPRKKNE